MLTDKKLAARKPLAMGAVMGYCTALGVPRIDALPGCWERQVDAQWWIAVNGHREPVACSRGPSVPPFTCYVEFDGRPAGFVSPRGGVLAAGEAIDENTFIAAVLAAKWAADTPAKVRDKTKMRPCAVCGALADKDGNHSCSCVPF